MASAPPQMMGQMPMMQQQPPAQQALPSGPVQIIAQLAAMPPKQAMQLVQMNMAQAQQSQNPVEIQLWQQVAQALQAGMQQQQGNIVSQTLGGGIG
jgi:hypothetical protein